MSPPIHVAVTDMYPKQNRKEPELMTGVLKSGAEARKANVDLNLALCTE